MNSRLWTWAAIVTGLALLASYVAFGMLPEMRAAGECAPAGSMLQFELARNADDLRAVFGASESECRPLVIAAMDALNRLDMLAFIPLYTAFCVAAAMFLARGAPRLLAIGAVLAALGGAAADYLETTTLMSLTQTLDAPDALIPQLQLGAWSKFALLAAHAFFCAGLCLNDAKRRPILGVLLLAPALGVAVAAFDHVRFADEMNNAFTLAWTALLVMAARDALTPAPG